MNKAYKGKEHGQGSFATVAVAACSDSHCLGRGLEDCVSVQFHMSSTPSVIRSAFGFVLKPEAPSARPQPALFRPRSSQPSPSYRAHCAPSCPLRLHLRLLFIPNGHLLYCLACHVRLTGPATHLPSPQQERWRKEHEGSNSNASATPLNNSL